MVVSDGFFVIGYGRIGVVCTFDFPVPVAPTMAIRGCAMVAGRVKRRNWRWRKRSMREVFLGKVDVFSDVVIHPIYQPPDELF